MRKRLYEIIDLANDTNKASLIYDKVMIVLICVSIIPLLFKSSNYGFLLIDRITAALFGIDYILRLITADYKYNSHKWTSFVRYPFSMFAIIDLLAISPAVINVNAGLKLFRIFRFGKALKALKFLRYSKSFNMIINVINKQKDTLAAVCYLSFGYVFLSALIMYSVETESFENFFHSVYWAVITLTGVGYGDIYPVSNIGRLVSMVSSFVGIAIVALPTGIITAGFMTELENQNNEEN